MSALLSDLVAAGTINGLDGDDERLAKLERASAAVAKELKDGPALLIRAILAGLDPDIFEDDPLIVLAERFLTAEWKSIGSVFPDKPIGWLRAILLSACVDVADGPLAAILWLTAADTLPRMRLGKEEAAIRRALEQVSEAAERFALSQESPSYASSPRDVVLPRAKPLKAPTAPEVDEEAFVLGVGAAACQKLAGRNLENANRHGTHQHPHWATHFTNSIAPFLAGQLADLAVELTEQQATIVKATDARQQIVVDALGNALTNQRRWVHEALKRASARQTVEHLRLDALWWSQAMYSPSCRQGYRELPFQLVSAIMAFDLFDVLTIPTPASVGYLLTETVARLPDCGHTAKRKLAAVLDALRESRDVLPMGWTEDFVEPPAEGRLSIRDLVVLALGEQTWSADSALARAGLQLDAEMTLPDLARAVFRQEQAVRLAGRAQ